MARKKDVLKKIDIKTKASGAPLPLIQEDQIAPPAFYVIPAPDSLVLLGQAIQRSTQAPLVMVSIGWQEAPNIAPDYYNVEYSESSDFSNVQKRRANTTSATIEGLKANDHTYYFRVQAVAGGIYSEFSETLQVSTMHDDTPPPDVTGASAAFEYSNLVITYNIPISEILKDVEIKIYNAARTILYGTFYTNTNRFIWTAEQNIFATGGIPLTQVSVDIHTRSWTNEPSVPGVTVTATAPIPATPTGYTSNWISDTGIADEDFTTAWLSALNADSYDVTIDGRLFNTKDTRFVYRYEQNVKDHVPTLASGNNSFIWLLQSRDKLGQVSTPVNVTVTNAAPPNGVMQLSTVAGFSTIAVTVALLSNTIVQDFDHYEFALTSGSTVVQTINTPDPSVIFQVNAAGTYTPSVRMVDKFNQKNTVLTGSPVVLDVLTIDQLRAETQYTDWLGTSSSILDRLKDGVLYDGSGNYVSYAANASWQWVQATRPLLDRYKTITFSGFWSSTFNFYFQVDTPSGTVYYAGPITISANGSYLMTRYTNQATAQTNAYVFGVSGNGTKRFDFTQIEESRNIRLWFKDTVSLTGLYEFYPRRLVQSDDIEAESIRSINIAALGINADRIFATTLSSIVAFIGQLNIDATGWLYQGTGTGSSPTTGLKIFNSSGIGKLSTYNSGLEQITLDTDGRFKAGAGSVVIDRNGIQLTAPASATYDTTTAIDWYDASNNRGASVRGYVSGGFNTLQLDTVAVAGKLGQVNLYADGTNASSLNLIGASSLSQAYFTSRRIEIRSNISTYSGVEGILLFAHATNTIPDVWLSAGNLGVNVQANLSATAVSNGGYFVPTRDLSIGGSTNNYISWNDASGAEKWVLGYEGAASDRWMLYNNPGGYAFQVQKATNEFDVFGKIGSSAGIGGNTIFSVEATTSFLQTAIWSGEPGVSYNNGGIGYNYAPLNSGAMSRQWTGGGAAYIRMTTGGVMELHTISAAGADNYAFGIGPAGNVSVANKLMVGSVVTTPTHTLQLANDDAAKTTTTTWATTSTKDAKDKIKTRTGALERLKKVRLTDYETNGKFNTEKGVKGTGFIAEEIKDIYPDAVKEVSYVDEDGVEQRYLTFNPHEVFMDYAVAIQELTAEIEALKKKIK